MIKRIINQDKFKEELGNKIDYGVGNSRWSNTLEIERNSKVNLSDDKKVENK